MRNGVKTIRTQKNNFNMKLLDLRKIDETRHNRVTFIRVEPIDLQKTLVDIIAINDYPNNT